MPSDVDLLRALDDEPDTPSSVDIRRAITTARRRRVRRGTSYAGAAAVTALAVTGGFLVAGKTPDQALPVAQSAAPSVATPVLTAPTSCTPARLKAPGNAPMALVSGADPTGRYIVGRSYPKSGGYQAVIWHDGQGRDVAMPGDLEESLSDVNSSGTAVGWSYDETGQIPYVYRNGTVTRLGGAKTGSAEAINDAGRIVGYDDNGHALLWSSPAAAATRLPVPSGTKQARAADVDEDGTVAGSLDFARPYVWFPDGTHRELPMPTLNGKPAAIAMAFTIRNGWVTGMASASGSAAKGRAEAKGRGGPAIKPVAVRWNLGTGRSEVIGALGRPADAGNAQGWLVGTDGRGYAVLAGDAKPVVLPDLGRHRADGTATIASTLSDDGRVIAGQSDDRTGTIQAVVWRCQ